MKRFVVAAVLFGLAGCVGGTQAFMPGARLHGLRADGHREALYVLEGKRGRFGEAKIWSRGSVVAELDGAPRTVLHVGYCDDPFCRTVIVVPHRFTGPPR